MLLRPQPRCRDHAHSRHATREPVAARLRRLVALGPGRIRLIERVRRQWGRRARAQHLFGFVQRRDEMAPAHRWHCRQRSLLHPTGDPARERNIVVPRGMVARTQSISVVPLRSVPGHQSFILPMLSS